MHASLHGLGSVVALAIFGLPILTVIMLSLIELVLHYHIDFFKEAFVRKRGWTSRDPYFWWTLAADQTLHHLTYIAMAVVVVLRSG